MQTLTRELNFTGQDIFIGIDVHSNAWKVSILLNGITHRTFSQDPSSSQLGKYIRKNFPGANYLSAYEAGFTGFSTHRLLEKEGIKNIVVNPADIPCKDKDKRQKEDKRDSRKIASSLRNGELEAIHIPRRETEELRSLLQSRQNIVKEINRQKNRIKSLLYYYGITIPEGFNKASKHFSKPYELWLRGLSFETWKGKEALNSGIDIVVFLREKLLKITTLIREVSKEKEYKEDIDNLTSVPGIGLITAFTLMSEIEDINRFNKFDKLCSFVGLVPSTSSSGDREKTGSVTPRSNKLLRSMIIESAWIAVRHDPALMMSYQELCKRMKPNKAIVKIAKKLLNRIRFVMKNKQKYEKSIVC